MICADFDISGDTVLEELHNEINYLYMKIVKNAVKKRLQNRGLPEDWKSRRKKRSAETLSIWQ